LQERSKLPVQYKPSVQKNNVQHSDIAAARAVPIVGVVGAAVELKRDFGLCPFHAERSPSFHVDRRRNRFKCFGCGASGDTIEFVRLIQHIGFAEAVRSLAGGAAVSSPHAGQRWVSPARDNDDEKRTALARALWESADAPRLAQFYLNSRGYVGKLPDAVRGHRAVWCRESQRKRAAVIAAVTDSAGQITAVQRIWIETQLLWDGADQHLKGARSLDLKSGKMTLGPMRDGAVRLAPAGQVLGLAEGVETALACRKLFRIPAWATLGTARLGSVTLPDVVRQVVIFGDGGEPGRAAGEKAAAEYSRRGYTAVSEYPHPFYGDFNEQLIGLGR
jgi:DNA primase